jgi:YVTN family beta-propeller protein
MGSVMARIGLQAPPRGLAVDVATNRVYAAMWEADALAVIDGASNALVNSVSGIPGASGVATAGDRIYVTATRSDELFVVDGQKCAIIGRIAVGDAPYAVVCDPGRQRIYVANAGSDTVSVVDGRKNAQVQVVHLGGLGNPHGLAFDPIRERLYVTYALSPKHRAIAAIDTVSGQVVSRLAGNDKRTLFGAYGIVADPLRGWVYTTTLDHALILAGDTLRVVHTVPGVGPAYAFGMCANPLEGRLYIADALHGVLAAVSR